MRMEQLRCLVDIANTHSITHTAQRLFMTQPAVSKSMKQLEKDFGLDILVRTNEGVYLTAFGEELVEYAKRILAEEEGMMQLAQRYKQLSDSQTFSSIRVSSISSIANIVLPDVIANMDMAQQKCSLKMITANTLEELLYQVQEGQCDIGFFTYHEREIYRKFAGLQDTLQLDILAMDDVILVTSRKRYQHEPMEKLLDASANRISTIYNIHVIDEARQRAITDTMVISNDTELHRRLIEKNGAIVAMPKLAYQFFFNSKKYMTISWDDNTGNVPLMHGAIYRRDAGEMVKTLAAMIRKKMYTSQV